MLLSLYCVFFCRPENRKKLVIYRIQIELLTFFESNFSLLQMLHTTRGKTFLLEYIFRFMIWIIKRQLWKYFSAGKRVGLWVRYKWKAKKRGSGSNMHGCLAEKALIENIPSRSILFCKQPRTSRAIRRNFYGS